MKRGKNIFFYVIERENSGRGEALALRKIPLA